MLWFVIALALAIVPCRGNINYVRKCCAESQILSLEYYQCRENDLSEINQSRLEDALELKNLKLTGDCGFPKCNKEDAFLNKQLSDVNQTIMGHFTDFCVDITINQSKFIVACVPNVITPRFSTKVSIRKCCGMFEMVMPGIGNCNATHEDFKPEFFEVNSSNDSVKLEIFAKDVDIVTPGCKNKFMVDEGEGWILGNGSLYILGDHMLDRDSFCVDTVIGFPESKIFYCGEEEKSTRKIEFLFIAIGLITSIIFLTATFLIYATAWKKQNSYGRSLVCHLASMIFAYICLAALQLQPFGLRIPDGLCHLIGTCVNSLVAYVMLFSFLAAFFWLNIMCFDIWRTFRSIRPLDSLQRGPKVLRFCFYSLYAWGMPVSLTLLTMVVANYKLLPEPLLPVIENCWLSRNTYGYHIFFIAPISTIIVCDLVLYVITAWKCYQVKKDIRKRSKMDKKRETSFFKEKEQLMLNIKLFVVMGITWSMEVVSFLFKSELKEYTSAHLWYMTDAINALYGLIIFLIFAIKKKNLRKVTRRLSVWMDKRRSGSESLIDFRKTSTTMSPSTIDTSLGETGVD